MNCPESKSISNLSDPLNWFKFEGAPRLVRADTQQRQPQPDRFAAAHLRAVLAAARQVREPLLSGRLLVPGVLDHLPELAVRLADHGLLPLCDRTAWMAAERRSVL